MKKAILIATMFVALCAPSAALAATPLPMFPVNPAPAPTPAPQPAYTQPCPTCLPMKGF